MTLGFRAILPFAALFVVAACRSSSDGGASSSSVTPPVPAKSGESAFDLDYSEGGGGPYGRELSFHVRDGGAVELSGNDNVTCPGKGPGRNTFIQYGGDGGPLRFTMTPAHFAALQELTGSPAFKALPATFGTGPGSEADGMDIRVALRSGAHSQTTLAKPDYNQDKMPAPLKALHDLAWKILEEEKRVPPEHFSCRR